MKRGYRFLLVALVLGAAAAAAQGATLFVPGSYATIQSAISASRSGDVVQVSAGTFRENLTIKAGVQVIGAGIGATILDGKASYITVYFPYNATRSTRLEGFTVQNGSYSKGGGVYFQSGSAAVLSNCEVRNNKASVRGGGVYIDNMASPLIEFSRITENEAYEGAGIYAQTASPTIRWNVICGNTAASTGGGIHFAYCGSSYSGAAVLEQNTIAYNTSASGYGAGISIVGSSLTLRNNIIAFNSGGCGAWSQDCTLTDACSIVYGNGGGNYCGAISAGLGSVSADPLFCGQDCNDLSVSGSSPAVTNQTCGLIGALTVGCGETSTQNSSWGKIKSMYR